jgi:hypothetical protein
MIKKNKAEIVIELLGQGYSAQEIKNRVAVSASYVYMIKKQLAEGIFTPEEVEAAATTIRPSYDPEAGEYIVVEGAKSAQEVDAILNTRAPNYGSFLGLSQVTQRLKAVAHQFAGQNNKTFDADQAEALDLIFTKIGRILNGDPNHLDSWIDIAGYATLVADRLQGKIR